MLTLKNIFVSLVRTLMVFSIPFLVDYFGNQAFTVFFIFIWLSSFLGAVLPLQGKRYYFLVPLQVFFFLLANALYYSVLSGIGLPKVIIEIILGVWSFVSGLIAEKKLDLEEFEKRYQDKDYKEIAYRFLAPFSYYFIFPMMIALPAFCFYLIINALFGG